MVYLSSIKGTILATPNHIPFDQLVSYITFCQPRLSSTMARFTVALLFVVALAYVVADECNDADCPCGQACGADGACVDGCKIYGQFFAVDTEAEVMGRKCKCGTEMDANGRFVGCEEGTEFVVADASTAGAMWTKNPNC